jgi:hypothetical protein
MSPTILKQGPYRFFFNSREETRMHVHVMTPDGTAKFWLEPWLPWPTITGFLPGSFVAWKRSGGNDKMSSSTPGAAILAAEPTNISAIGFWMLVDDREYFVPFDHYPAFRAATVDQIYRVERPAPDQLFWPDLDIDIDLAALDTPDRFPLTYHP